MKLRTLSRIAATVAAATCMAVAATAPASAGVKVPSPSAGDVLMLPGVGLAAATAEINLLNAEFAIDAAKQSPNTSCAPPTVAGYGSVGYDANVVVVRSADTVVAEGNCVNLTGQDFEVTLHVKVQYRSAPGAYSDTGCSGSWTGPRSSLGAGSAATVPLPLLCVHADPAVYGKEHVALATVWSSLGGYAQAYSQPWQG